MATKWRSQEVRNFNGVMHFNGAIYEVQGTSLDRLHHEPELGDWLNVAILAQEDLYGGQFVVKCGEALEHGSIGVVVLESLQTHEAVWTFVSDQTNPFDQIVVKGGWVLALSTSGAVFRFAAPFQKPSLLLPS
jgi:hypothetical protein